MDDMEVGESRKRPIDSDSVDHSSVKRSNYGEVLLKQLIPSHLAGVILGKGGETINSVKSATGTEIKMSKGSDYYPGTTDRICVITGSADSVRAANSTIWQKLQDRTIAPDKQDEELKMKIVVPNVTVGMIIGKNGASIKQIKDETGAFVKITQKANDMVLQERVVTIAGTKEQMRQAFERIFEQIVEDPQSNSCPNVSYADFKGPVASAYPDGPAIAHQNQYDMSYSGGYGGYPMGPRNPCPMPNMGPSITGPSNPGVESLKATLINSGYSVQAANEISYSMYTLATYGLLNSTGYFGYGMGQYGGLTLEYLASVLSGHTPGNAMNSVMGGNMGNMTAQKGGPFDSSNNSGATGTPQDMYNAYMMNMNMNAFGGMVTGGAVGSGKPSDHTGDNATKELQIGENIVGAVLGRGGRSIVDIQQMTSTSIQLSKKGIYAPGTRNRIATITGPSAGVDRACELMQQCIQQEEQRRRRE